MNKFEETISALIESFQGIKEVLTVYVYGSVARGDYSLRHSDLDLLIFIDKPGVGERLKKKIDDIIIPTGSKLGVRVHPEYQGHIIRQEDRTLIAKIIEEGRIIFSRGLLCFNDKQLGFRPYLVYEFSSKDSSDKTTFSKVLHGSKSWYYKEGKKIVKKYTGIADNKGIILVGRGCLLIRKDKQKDMELVFKRFGIKFELKKILYG
jgi:predicted nucleotidyltransferase